MFDFGCNTCGEEVEFTGDKFSATGHCSTCGVDIEISPIEMWDDWGTEAEIDAARDAHWED